MTTPSLKRKEGLLRGKMVLYSETMCAGQIHIFER